MTVENNKGTEMERFNAANSGKAMSEENLAGIKDVASAFDALAAQGANVEDMSDFGSGFEMADKNSLIGAELLIVGWRFTDGDFGTFVSCAAVTRDGRRVIFNDGSSGIREQLSRITNKRLARGDSPETVQAGLHCKKGLRVSDYEYADPTTGEMRPARTYYLA